MDTDAETLVTTMRNVICRPEGTDEDYPSLAVVKEALVRLVPKYGVCQMFAGGQQHCAQEAIECILSVLESTAFVDMTGVKTEQTTTYICETEGCNLTRTDKSYHFINMVSAATAPTLDECLRHVGSVKLMTCNACHCRGVQSNTWQEKTELTKIGDIIMFSINKTGSVAVEAYL